MEKKGIVWPLAWAGSALLGALLLGLLLHTLAAAAAGGLAGGAVALLVDRLLKRHPTPGEGAAAEEPGMDLHAHLQTLLRLNLAVRKAGLPAEPLAKIEQVIDRLMDLLPRLYRDYPSLELTWEVKRIAAQYLPELVNRYLALNAAQRAARQAELEENLGRLDEAISRAVRLVDEKKEDKFQTLSFFLNLKFPA